MLDSLPTETLISLYQDARIKYKVACDMASDPRATSAERQRARRDRRNYGRKCANYRQALRVRGLRHGAWLK